MFIGVLALLFHMLVVLFDVSAVLCRAPSEKVPVGHLPAISAAFLASSNSDLLQNSQFAVEMKLRISLHSFPLWERMREKYSNSIQQLKPEFSQGGNAKISRRQIQLNYTAQIFCKSLQAVITIHEKCPKIIHMDIWAWHTVKNMEGGWENWFLWSLCASI